MRQIGELWANRQVISREHLATQGCTTNISYKLSGAARFAGGQNDVLRAQKRLARRRRTLRR